MRRRPGARESCRPPCVPCAATDGIFSTLRVPCWSTFRFLLLLRGGSSGSGGGCGSARSSRCARSGGAGGGLAVTRVVDEDAGRCELTQLVADHVLGHEHREELAPVVH